MYQSHYGVERGAGSEEQVDFFSPKNEEDEKNFKKSLKYGTNHATNPVKK